MSQNESPSMFSKENYMWMLIGVVVIALGMFLMSGGKSNVDPNVFDKDAVYSPRRITIAPILILAGLVIEMYAIFKKPRLNAAGQAKEKTA
jgi:hypothetical protein